MIPRVNPIARSGLFVFLFLFLVSAAALAGTTGNLTGYVRGPEGAPRPGVHLTVTSPFMIGSRTATTDARGFYRVTQLPPGEDYHIRYEAAGYQTTEFAGIVVHVDETIKLPTVNLSVVREKEAIDITSNAPVIDTGRQTIGQTLSGKYLTEVPTGRDSTAVLQLAPGAATDLLGTTFRGATSPENNYVIDGLNTTGIVFGLDSSALPPEFIQEIQVKTGGYEPEYGRATGGQSIVITKSGGNEFHGDIFLYVTPYEGPRHTTVSGDHDWSEEDGGGGAAARIYNLHTSLLAQAGFDIGGYIIKDRLWFFAGYAPEYRRRLYSHEFRLLEGLGEREDLYTEAQTNPQPSDSAIVDEQTRLAHYYIANLTFNINQNHSVRLSATGNPMKTDGVLYTTFYEPGNYLAHFLTGSTDFSMKYNGQFLGGLVNLDVIAGYHSELNWQTPWGGEYQSVSGNSPFDGMDIDGSASTIRTIGYREVEGGCANLEGTESGIPCSYWLYREGGLGQLARTTANRMTLKPILSIFVNNLVGNHVFKIGGDVERNHVINRRAYPGGPFVDRFVPPYGDFYREQYYSNFGEPITWKGVDDMGTVDEPGSYYIAETYTWNQSAFIQDSWSVLPSLSLNLGVRWERQELRDAQGIPRIVLNDNIAPRFGLNYDFTGEGKSKLFVGFGRYYESIPQDVNDRALSAEGFNRYYFDATEDYSPGGQSFDDAWATQFLGGEVSPIQKGLKGQYADEYLLGFEYEVAKGFQAGVTAVFRNLGNVIEDISPDDGDTYLIANPGADNFEYYITEVDEEGNLSEPTVAVDEETGEAIKFRRCISASDPMSGAPASYCFPKAERFYRALEFEATKRFSDNWVGNASYTLSQSYGNYPGLFAQSRGQLDPNITSQFDLANLLSNRYGYLDTDRRHLVKFSGSYRFNFGTSAGLTVRAQSGVPVLYLGAHAVYGGGEAFLLPRGYRPNDAPADIPTRTPWVFRVDAKANHTFTFENQQSLGVGVQVNNLLNLDAFERLDQGYTTNVASPAVGGTSLDEVQCYEEAYYTPVSSCRRQPNSGTAMGYQAPLSVRLEVKYSF